MVEWINGINVIKYENAGTFYLFKGFKQCLTMKDNDIRFDYKNLKFKLIKVDNSFYEIYINDKYVCKLELENNSTFLYDFDPEDFFAWLEFVIVKYNMENENKND